MSMREATPYTTAAAKDWLPRLRGYCIPSARRGAFELSVTALPFAVLWAAMASALAIGQVWLYAILCLPAAGFLVRLFMIAHDCGHAAFFPDRRANDWTGRIIGIFTWTPYDLWRHAHAIHHAGSGNLARRGIGDIHTMTVGEYRALGLMGRLRYRLYRHPAVMFGLGPIYVFGIQQRLPFGFMRRGWVPWASVMGTNLGIAVVAAGLIALVGPLHFLLVQVPVILIAASVGVWLFYVQHQFDGSTWVGPEEWQVHEAALHGSSHYDLPPVLRWFTANIGVHHVHHLVSRVPFYRLPQVLRDFPELAAVGRLSILRSFACVKLSLWDEQSRCFVSFREERSRRPAAEAERRADRVLRSFPPARPASRA